MPLNKSDYTIHETEYLCDVKDGEFNATINKTIAKSGSLNNRLLKLAQKHEDIINGSKNPKKTSNFVAPKMTKETIDYHYNRTTTKGQWVFSKYLGLLFVDRMMDLSTGDQDKVANLIALYAFSFFMHI